MPEKRLNTEELAKALGVNKMTIYRELKRDDCSIPYNRIGRNNFFYLSEVLLATKVTPIEKQNMIFLLNSLLIGSCSCVTKTPDESFHEELCMYRRVKDIINYISSTNRKKDK